MRAGLSRAVLLPASSGLTPMAAQSSQVRCGLLGPGWLHPLVGSWWWLSARVAGVTGPHVSNRLASVPRHYVG